ncbi:multicopper oxidase domain-containing protein [Aetokthonos hydrillicola Thurmond2011]|jgi:FtsP/CotA-like multicopper oxidase with cupredoxin domain|uniref:Copper-containing nitrite reductase n=1 Tax=Aetokthonos hydrillicola Thurmond2011 TaxID=2712845 RepID=A0AAP5IBJ5_9CYAN|nr:multicopper oxidase domain-containing protein [Aetokthonos hydrillicola]MBW4584314.1 multicopper oxidase domain-containing protein [Aetokthonos hydrillicola CCALA 1050]MDR9898478.1 multicopper oxidase domain-containing protein [Aetokthonos hydrillicola Thurmond2011]
MSNHLSAKLKSWNRRQFLKVGLAGVGLTGAALALSTVWSKQKTPVKVPPLKNAESPTTNGINPLYMLRDFDYGTVKQENGRTVREYHFEARTTTLQLTKAVDFASWNINGRVPGPTIRATEGDRIRVIFHNRAGHSHSLHFHGIHPVEMDGVVPIRHGSTKVLEFDAEPFGVHLYHCHIPPISRHIGKGLYGMFIIDPVQGRPSADEMVMIMSGYDLNGDGRNELYAFNGIPDYYKQNPIPIQQDQLIRLYLLNMTEFEPALTFHIHANMFQVYRTGRTLTPNEETDVITMGVAERHILEFSFRTPGMYMFHPHQDQIAEAGCMGNFNVIKNA